MHVLNCSRISRLGRLEQYKLLSKPSYMIIILLALSCVSCQIQTNKPPQPEILETAIGQLSLEYAKLYSYRGDYVGVHGAKISGRFSDIYDEYIKDLDEQYRVEYFLTSLWTIPFEGSEIDNFTSTVIQDGTSAQVLQAIDSFLKQEQQHPYQPERYAYITIVASSLKASLAFASQDD